MQVCSRLSLLTRVTLYATARCLCVIHTSTRLNPNSAAAKYRSMASVTGPAAPAKDIELPHLLETVTLQSQHFPSCYPDSNPTDVYRAHIATCLSQVTKIDALTIYPTLQWTQTLEKGDLRLAVAALGVKGRQPAELAKEWAEQVSRTSLCSQCAPALR